MKFELGQIAILNGSIARLLCLVVVKKVWLVFSVFSRSEVARTISWGTQMQQTVKQFASICDAVELYILHCSSDYTSLALSNSSVLFLAYQQSRMTMASEFGHLDEVCDKSCTRHKFGKYACAMYCIVMHVVSGGRYDRGCGVRLRPLRQVLATAALSYKK